jgi:hypothetical protein
MVVQGIVFTVTNTVQELCATDVSSPPSPYLLRTVTLLIEILKATIHDPLKEDF